MYTLFLLVLLFVLSFHRSHMFLLLRIVLRLQKMLLYIHLIYNIILILSFHFRQLFLLIHYLLLHQIHNLLLLELYLHL